MSRDQPVSEPSAGACGTAARVDYLLWGSLSSVVVLYAAFWLSPGLLSAGVLAEVQWPTRLAEAVFVLMNTVWWGLLAGIVMVGLLSKIPREFVMAALGDKRGLKGLVRAAVGGVLLDLCSHGILMVGAKLYERGANAGQMIAFLIASPWNSLSLTLVLIALIGLPWTLAFIVLSLIIAVIAGFIFEQLVARNVLPDNPNQTTLPDDFRFWAAAAQGLKRTRYTSALFKEMAVSGVTDSRMVMRWILFGLLLAGLVRTFMDAEMFQTYFGPTLLGLGATLLVATVLEVCSEGSAPVAADIVTRAKAPGNGFAFLMAGVSTDYTEVMVLKEATRSWKLALFLPLVTLPQIVLAGWLINVATAN